MTNEWKAIWNKREEFISDKEDTPESVFMKLKALNGFDSVKGGLSYESFCKQHDDMMRHLQKYESVKSIYEIGCGAGANLYMAECNGLSSGGIDYSKSLIQSARAVLHTTDLAAGEAIDMQTMPPYDAVISNSVFGYFETEEYAERVIEIAIQKAKKVVAVLDVHDAAKKEDLLAYQRQVKEDYDTRYKNLPVRCYEKEWFQSVAEKHGCEVVFADMEMQDYWNAKYSYDVYIYRT